MRGMNVEAYVSWSVRLLALQARPGEAKQRGVAANSPGRRADQPSEDSESAAWTESFAQRLSHRTDRCPPDTELWL
ncbi:hypothetical protein ACWDNI_28690 [Nocardia niigatensis]